VVVLKGLQPRDDGSVDLGAPSEWESGGTPALSTFGNPGGLSVSLAPDPEVSATEAIGKPEGIVKPAVLTPQSAPSTAEPAKTDGNGPVIHEGGTWDYVVKDGEVLSLIAQRKLGSVRHMAKIIDLNPEVGPDGDNVYAGQTLVMPSRADLEPSRPKSPAQRRPELAGVRTHEVVSGDSLWQIASDFYGNGDVATMERIVQANPDRLNSVDTTLGLGWVLVIPE
jgi:nucleoid-associated protein YgaU